MRTRKVYFEDLGVPNEYRTLDEVSVEAVRDANLVGSLLDDGKHAPALDIDVPSALVRRGEESILWVDVKTSRLAWVRLSRALRRAGMGGGGGPLSLLERKAAYAEERERVVENTSFVEMLCALGPESMQDFPTTWMGAAVNSAPEGVKEGVAMESPWPIRLLGEVHLIPSTSHAHLYQEVAVEWRVYVRVLKALARAGVIEKGYYGVSRARGRTQLRLPWVKKPVAAEEILSFS